MPQLFIHLFPSWWKLGLFPVLDHSVLNCVSPSPYIRVNEILFKDKVTEVKLNSGVQEESTLDLEQALITMIYVIMR